MAIVGIAAVDRNGAIGKGGKLPWHYKADLRFFREQTTGHSCVMGYRTWLSLRDVPLKDRLNLVLSRETHVTRFPSVVFLTHHESVLEINARARADTFIIGGAETYRLFLPHIERWIITEVPLTIADADTFMPDGYLDEFALNETRDLGDGLAVKFYSRKHEGAAMQAWRTDATRNLERL